MPEGFVGLRRVYAAINCSLEGMEELFIPFSFQDKYFMSLYIGAKPKYGINLENKEKYVVVGGPPILRVNQSSDVTQTNYKWKFFSEISCSIKVELPSKTTDTAKLESSSFSQELLMEGKKRSDEFKEVLDLIAGVLGLRFHQQFVKELLNENFVFRIGEEFGWEYDTGWLEQQESISLTSVGMQDLNQILTSIGDNDSGKLIKASNILQWLIRGWHETVAPH